MKKMKLAAIFAGLVSVEGDPYIDKAAISGSLIFVAVRCGALAPGMPARSHLHRRFFFLRFRGQKKQQLEKEEHLLEKSRQEAQKMKLQREQYQQQLGGLKDSSAAFERTAAQIAVNEQQCRKTEVLQEKVVQNKNLVNEMYRIQKRYIMAAEQLAQAGSIYEEMEKRYFDEQAGILAQNLREDEALSLIHIFY